MYEIRFKIDHEFYGGEKSRENTAQTYVIFQIRTKSLKYKHYLV